MAGDFLKACQKCISLTPGFINFLLLIAFKYKLYMLVQIIDYDYRM